jgi:hypothetical protein
LTAVSAILDQIAAKSAATQAATQASAPEKSFMQAETLLAHKVWQRPERNSRGATMIVSSTLADIPRWRSWPLLFTIYLGISPNKPVVGALALLALKK